MKYDNTIQLLPPLLLLVLLLLWSVPLLLWSVPKVRYDKNLVYISVINTTCNISD